MDDLMEIPKLLQGCREPENSPEIMREHADYMETVTDFVGSPDAVARALRYGAAEIERLRASYELAEEAALFVLRTATQTRPVDRDRALAMLDRARAGRSLNPTGEPDG